MTTLNWFTVIFAGLGFLSVLTLIVLVIWSLLVSRDHAANEKQRLQDRRDHLHADAVARAYEETVTHDLLELWFDMPTREPRAW